MTAAVDSIPDGLPGRDLVVSGLADVRAGRETVQSLLVEMAAPRLRAAGVDVSADAGRLDAGARMYRLLGARDPAGAYGTYNALRRRLVSFLEAFERADARRSDR